MELIVFPDMFILGFGIFESFHGDWKPRVSRAPQERHFIFTPLAVTSGILLKLYSHAGHIPWQNIFAAHHIMILLSEYLSVSSKLGQYARLRTQASSPQGTTWPLLSLQLLDAKVVVYLAFSLWHKHFYIGKTLDFRERLRKHIIGFLRPGMARPQPYMTYLTYAACGSPSLALSRTICVPIAMCEDETTALQLEQHLISTVHPSLNDPYAALCVGPGCTSSTRHGW